MLSWGEVPAPDFAGYKVWASTEGPEFAPSPTTLKYSGVNNQATFADLTLDRTWHFKVAAYDSFGADELSYAGTSIELSGTNVFDTEAPASPVGLTVAREGLDPTFSALIATWAPNTESDLSHYLVRFRKEGVSETVVYPAYTPAFRAEGFKSAVTYQVSLAATDKWGNTSDWSTEVPVNAVSDNTPPAAPTNQQIVCSFRAAFLTWENPTDLDFSHCEVYAGASNDVAQAEGIGESADGALTDVLSGYGEEKYYWIRAVDLAGNVSPWAGPVTASAGRVQVVDLEDFAVDASKLFTKIPVVDGDVWQDQQGGEEVSWNAHRLFFNGVKYDITTGTTGNKYVYWTFGASTYSTSAAYPALGDNDFLIATNVGGFHSLAWNSLANEVIGSAHIQQAAIKDAHVENLTGDKIRVGTLHGDRVITDTLDAQAIKTGTLTADRIVSFGAGVSIDGFIEPNKDGSGNPNPGEFTVGTWNDDGSKKYGTHQITVQVAGVPYLITGGMVAGDEAGRKSTMLMFTTDPSRFDGLAYLDSCSHIFQTYQLNGQWYMDDNAIGTEGTGGVPFAFNGSTDFIIGTFGWDDNGNIVNWQPALTAQTAISGNRITTGVLDASLVSIKGAAGETLIGGGKIILTDETLQTKVAPGLIEVKGGSGKTLADWVHAGGDGTLIDGGNLFTGSVTAESLQIGMQPNLLRKGVDCFDLLPDGVVFPKGASVEFGSVTDAQAYSGGKSLKARVYSATSPDIYLGDTSDDYHIPLFGGQSYILSGYAWTDSGAPVSGALVIHTSDGGAIEAAPFTGLVSGDGRVRVHGRFTLPVEVNAGLAGVRLTTADSTVYFDCLQLEAAVSNVTFPGPWRPSGITTIDGGLLRANSLSGDCIRADSSIIIGKLDGTSDYVVLDGSDGTLKTYKYIAGAMRQYRSLTRRESGIANSGVEVTIPGYFEAQPDIQVSINTLASYDPDYAGQRQTWSCRAEGIQEATEGKWAFMPVARLELGAASGATAVNQTATTSSNSYTSPEYETPNNTSEVTVTAQLKSVRGTGTLGSYYYRKVDWRVGYCLSSGGTYLWTGWRSKSLGATLNAVADSFPLTLPSSGKWYIKIEYLAADAGGTFATGVDPYLYEEETINTIQSEVSTTVSSAAYWPGDTEDTDAASLPFAFNSYAPPSGYSIYNVTYDYQYAYYLNCIKEGLNNTPYPYTSATVAGAGYSHTVTHEGTEGNSELTSWSQKTVTSSSFDQNYLSGSLNTSATASLNVSWSNSEAKLKLKGGSATIQSKKLQTNSTTPSNDYAFQSYTYTLSSAQILASGVLNWIAIGE
jgi:hypothetical protein